MLPTNNIDLIVPTDLIIKLYSYSATYNKLIIFRTFNFSRKFKFSIILSFNECIIQLSLQSNPENMKMKREMSEYETESNIIFCLTYVPAASVPAV